MHGNSSGKTTEWLNSFTKKIPWQTRFALTAVSSMVFAVSCIFLKFQPDFLPHAIFFVPPTQLFFPVFSKFLSHFLADLDNLYER
jgi:hypothetical protein